MSDEKCPIDENVEDVPQFSTQRITPTESPQCLRTKHTPNVLCSVAIKHTPINYNNYHKPYNTFIIAFSRSNRNIIYIRK